MSEIAQIAIAGIGLVSALIGLATALTSRRQEILLRREIASHQEPNDRPPPPPTAGRAAFVPPSPPRPRTPERGWDRDRARAASKQASWFGAAARVGCLLFVVGCFVMAGLGVYVYTVTKPTVRQFEPHKQNDPEFPPPRWDTPAATPNPGQPVGPKVIYGPVDRTIQPPGPQIDNQFAPLVFFDQSVYCQNGTVEVGFLNPTPISQSGWEQSRKWQVMVSIRAPVSNERHGYRMAMRADGSCWYGLITSAGEWKMWEVPVPAGTVNLAQQAKNTIRVVYSGGRGRMYLNGLFLSELDLSHNTGDGLTRAGASWFADQFPVSFEGFRVTDATE